MTKPVIEIANLSKRYRLGGMRSLDRTFREMLYDRVGALVGRARRSDLNTASHREEKDRREFWALRDVSFDVDRGEVIGIVGANGAGKSTLLKILSRITDPTEGKAVIRGRVGSLLEVGTGMHPELSGRENIYLNGAVLGMKKREIDAAFDQIVDFSGVEQFLDTPVKRYSSGMKVRLAFAVAAHLHPEVLIVDEVLAVGDAAFQEKCLGKMKDIAAGEGRTVLFVSHNMAAVQQLCHRAVLLSSGKIIKQGEPGDIVAAYLNNGADDAPVSGCDLQTIARAEGMGQQVRLDSWQLCDAEGKLASSLCFAEPITIRLRITANEPINDLILSVGIHSRENVAITQLSSERQVKDLNLQPGESAEVTLQARDLKLLPGRYVLSLGIRSTLASLDHVPNAGVFDISELLYDPQLTPNLHRGLVHSQPDWNVDRHTTNQPSLAA